MKTLLRVLVVAMAASMSVNASAATAISTATVKVAISRRGERVAVEAERMTRYLGVALNLNARQESKLFYMNLEWAERCDDRLIRIDLDNILDRWYYEYTRDLNVILNNRQMRVWRRMYGRRYNDYNRPRASISINIGARPHVHIGAGHKNPHKDPHTRPHVAPHKDPHTRPHVAPHTAPHTKPHTAPHNGSVGNGNNRPSNNRGNVGSSNNRPSSNKGAYRSSDNSNRGKSNATRGGSSTRSSNSSNDKGTSSRGR